MSASKAQVLFHLKRRLNQLERGGEFRSAVQQADADMPYAERKLYEDNLVEQRAKVNAECAALLAAANFIEEKWQD